MIDECQSIDLYQFSFIYKGIFFIIPLIIVKVIINNTLHIKIQCIFGLKEVFMKVKDMCFYALFVVLIAVGAFIKLPISIVPITLQTLFIILAAFVLKENAVSLTC